MSFQHMGSARSVSFQLTAESQEYKSKARLENAGLTEEKRRGGVKSLGVRTRNKSLSPPLAVSAVDT